MSSTATTTTPTRKQTALDLTCALLSTGQFTSTAPEDAAREAVELLNLVEHELKVVQTPHR